MIETAQRTIEPLVMIEDRASAIYIERCSKLLRNARQIDVFAAKLPVVVMKGVHWQTVAAQKLQGRAISLQRVKCAMLAWRAVEQTFQYTLTLALGVRLSLEGRG